MCSFYFVSKKFFVNFKPAFLEEEGKGGGIGEKYVACLGEGRLSKNDTYLRQPVKIIHL